MSSGLYPASIWGKRSFHDSTVSSRTSPDSPLTAMPLILYRVLNFSSHPFEALKFSSYICSATATAFARSMGPKTGMFLFLAILNHSNIAESMFWNLHILALLLAAFPFVANLSSNFRLSRRVDWICVLPHWNFSAISRIPIAGFLSL